MRDLEHLPSNVAVLVEAAVQLAPDDYRLLMAELRKQKWREDFKVTTRKDWRRWKDLYHHAFTEWWFAEVAPVMEGRLKLMDAVKRKKLAGIMKGRPRDPGRFSVFEQIEAKLDHGDLDDLRHAFRAYRAELGQYTKLRSFSVAYRRWAKRRTATP